MVIAALRRRLEARVVRYVRSRYAMVKPEPTQGLFNFRCHENAVEYQRRHPDLEVVEVIYIDDGVPILHYLNRDPARDVFLETTLGWRAAHLEYHVIRRIHPEDYPHIHREFERALASWTEQFVNGFCRNILGFRRIL